jgi:hypothetical protein
VMASYPIDNQEKLPIKQRAELCTNENMLLPDILRLTDIVGLWEVDTSKHRALTESLLNQVRMKTLPVYTCGLYRKKYTCLYVQGKIASIDGILNRIDRRSAFQFSGVDATFTKDLKNGVWPDLGITANDLKNVLSNDLPPVEADLANSILNYYTPEPLPAFIEKLPIGFNRITIHKTDFKKWLIDNEQWSIDNCLLEKWFADEQSDNKRGRYKGTADRDRLEHARKWVKNNDYEGGKPDKWIVNELRKDGPGLWGNNGVSTFKKWLQSDFGKEGQKLFPNLRR